MRAALSFVGCDAPAPRSEAELGLRARSLAGLSLGELARACSMPLPSEPRRAKGFAGRLVERALRAEAAAHEIVDFPAMGIELKTLPVDAHGRPRESTFVCHLDLARAAETEWEQSRVKRKLSRVLFVPIESGREVAYAARRIGTPFTWSPSPEQQAILKLDYEELVGCIGHGGIEGLDARMGRALQLRPKAANASMRTRANDADGAPSCVNPRGFYLRASFTAQLVSDAGLLSI